MKSPFKFLDSYTKEDRSIFFGRDQEITELYRRVFESKILLVYGVSGTGKSSLINCGLASRFDDSDWLPVNVRRGSNMIDSLNEAFNKQAIRPLKKNLSVSDKLQSIYLDHFKPVYLIFDQFEELFIFGSSEEKTGFIKLIKEIVKSETQCRILFIIREEFLAGITEFEYDLPEIFSNRFRVEKMKRANAIQAIEGPCKVQNIETEPGFSDELIDKLSPAGNEIELTYLQIYLDRILRLASDDRGEIQGETDLRALNYPPSQGGTKGGLVFSTSLLSRSGNVSDLLGQFLEEQIRELDDPDTGMSILKSFVSVQGTKMQMNESQILDSVGAFGTVITEPDLLKYLTKFVDLRILRERDESGHFELRHDALAAKIFEKFTAIEKDIIEVRQFIENAWHDWQKRGELLSVSDLQYIKPYENRLYLSKDLSGLIERSNSQLIRIKRRRRNITVGSTIVLLAIFAGFTLWALNERRKALKERETANLNFIKAKANNLNYLSQKVLETDPTIAFRIAECALKLDSQNVAITENLNKIYSENNFYKIVLTQRMYHEDKSIVFSQDGKNILISSPDSISRLYDLQGNVQQEYKIHGDLGINSVNFSPDGKSILTASDDYILRLWDLQGNIIQVFKGHEDEISSVVFSPGGNSILTGSWDMTARLWDLKGNVLSIFKGHEEGIISVAFSPDGKNILTGSEDNTARLWTLNGNLIRVFKGHESWINSVSFSPDGKSILTGSDDKTARLWDLKGSVLQVFKGHDDAIYSISFSPDGKNILTGSFDKTARLWDMQGNVLQIFKGHEDAIFSVTFSPDSKKILTGSYDNTLRSWKLEGLEPIVFKKHNDWINSVAFSPDGRSILTGSDDKTACLWNLQGDLIKQFTGHKDGISMAAFSPDGKSILTGSYDNTVRLWNTQGNILREFTGHRSVISTLAISPDGNSFLTFSLDSTARLWDLQGNVIKEFKGLDYEVFSVAFSPDGKSFLFGSADSTAQLWDLTGNVLHIFKGHELYVHSVAFSPDGKNILTGSCDKTARLWDLNGNILKVFKGHQSHVHSVAFSPDGKCILTGSMDKTTRLWSLDGTLLQVINGFGFVINSVTFSPDGKGILIGSAENTARLWEIKKPLNEYQSENAYQELTVEQKVKYGILELSDILSLNDEKSLVAAAEYYYAEINRVGKENKSECINNALTLYQKLENKYKSPNYLTMKDSLVLMQRGITEELRK